MSELLVIETSSPSVNGGPHILEKPADYPHIVVAGGSKEFKEHIKSLGGKWVAKERGYVLPASQREHISSLVDAAKFAHAEEVTTAEPTAETAGHAADPSSSSSAAMVTEEPVGTMEGGACSSADGAGDGGGEPETGMDEAGLEPGPAIEPASEPAHEAKPVIAELASAEPTAGTSTSAAPYSNLSIVVLNSRSIGVIGEPTPDLNNEFNLMGGKFTKTLKIGDDKHAGWSFHKNQLAKLQTLLPNIPLTPAPAPSPIGTRSPTERKKTPAAVVGTSSKADTPVSSPENKNKNKNKGDTGESGDKRKRKRTTKAEEAQEQQQAHALASAPTATATTTTPATSAAPAQVEV